MGTVNSTSSGLSNLLQSLSTDAPQLASVLSQPKVQSALENASPGDVIELSDQALQLQQVSSLFGNSDGTQSDPLLSSLTSGNSTDANSDPILQALGSSFATEASNAASSSTASTGTATSLADQLSNTQAQQLESLFGSAPTVDPLLNTVG